MSRFEIDRRTLLAAAAASALPLPALAEVATETVTLGGFDKLTGYLAKPSGGGKRPAVIVGHSTGGLDEHARAVARRLASMGYLALAPDYLSPWGGTPADRAKAGGMLGTIVLGDQLDMSKATFASLRQRPDCTGKVGAVGFSWGGGLVSDLAVIEPELKVSVPYYAPQSIYFLSLEFKAMRAAMQMHYAGKDRAINTGIFEFETTLRNQATIPVEIHFYSGAARDFADETNPATYKKEAAELAWTRTAAYLKRYLV